MHSQLHLAVTMTGTIPPQKQQPATTKHTHTHKTQQQQQQPTITKIAHRHMHATLRHISAVDLNSFYSIFKSCNQLAKTAQP